MPEGFGKVISKRNKEKYARGEKFGFYKGYKHTKESIEKIKREMRRPERIKIAIKNLSKIDNRGEKHPMWKGGISREYKEGFGGKEYKRWRMEVFLRDSFTCQFCGVKGIYLTAHHIKSWAKFPELRFDVNNGVTLCEDCHSLTDNYRGRGHLKM